MNKSRPYDDDHAADIYSHVIASFALGMFRFYGTEAAHSRLMCALMEYRSASMRGEPSDGGANVFGHLEKIPFSSYEALRHVTDLSLLVYATTLLDTFLSDTTLFLLLRFPESLGKNQQVPLNSMLGASSVHALLSEAATRKTREISFLSFDARVDFLRHTFGLVLALDDDTTVALKRYATLRNTAVHDQGIYELGLDDTGRLVARQKTCPVHPSVIGEAEIDAAVAVYRKVVEATATAVMAQCLKRPSHPALEQLVRTPTETAEGTTVTSSKDVSSDSSGGGPTSR